MKNSYPSQQTPLDKELMYVDFDEETNDWCVFDDNGFAHSSWSSKQEAEKQWQTDKLLEYVKE